MSDCFTLILNILQRYLDIGDSIENSMQDESAFGENVMDGGCGDFELCP